MKTLLIVTLLAVGATAAVLSTSDVDAYWAEWKAAYGKNYDHGIGGEESMRRMVWETNLKMITRHNEKYSLKKTTFQLAMNEFGDMTNAEFIATRTGLKKGLTKQNFPTTTFLEPAFLSLPDSVDWRKEGYVTPIKNQGKCGACWAFSAIGSLEGQHFKQTGQLVSLSEQNLVDCSAAEGDAGCNGGWPVWGYNYILKNHGIDTEDGYPYVGEIETCHFKEWAVGATITGVTEIKAKSEHALQKALASQGPISVCIDASQLSFRFYASGVYNEPECSSWRINHCMLAVGYDQTSAGDEYYIVKNSWGTGWGQDGYIWMSRDNHNQCGIATNASYPLV